MVRAEAEVLYLLKYHFCLQIINHMSLKYQLLFRYKKIIGKSLKN